MLGRGAGVRALGWLEAAPRDEGTGVGTGCVEAASEVGRRLRAAAPESLPLRPPEVLQFDLLFCSANLFFPPLIEFCTVVFFPFLLP